jgi:hypothetical protein
MKTFLIQLAASVAVAVAFAAIGRADLRGGQELVALWVALILLRLLFIPRYPKATALREALRLKRGQKVEVEGK